MVEKITDDDIRQSIDSVLEDVTKKDINVQTSIDGPVSPMERMENDLSTEPPDLKEDLESYDVAGIIGKGSGKTKKPNIIEDTQNDLPEDAIDTDTVYTDISSKNNDIDFQKIDEVKEEIDFVYKSEDGSLSFKGFTKQENERIAKNFDLLLKGDLEPLQGGLNKLLRNSGDELFDFASMTDVIGDLTKAANRKTITIDEIEELASNIGRPDLYKAIRDVKKNKSANLNKEYAIRAVMEVAVVDLYAQNLGVKVMRGTATPLEQENFLLAQAELVALVDVIYEPVSDGAYMMRYTQTDSNFMQNIKRANKERREDILKFYKDGKIDIKALAFMMSDLTPPQRGHFQQNLLDVIISKSHDYASKTFDGLNHARHVITEIYINSKLSSPLTHIANVAGNTMWNSWRILEYSAAAGYNKVLGITDADAIQFNQVIEMIRGFQDGVVLGGRNAKEAFQTGRPKDGFDKVDLARVHTISRDKLGKYKDTPVGDLVEGLGFASRLPTNLLTAEDEFFKGVMYTMELRRLARGKYNQARKRGLTHEEASEVMESILIKPPLQIKEEARRLAREGTFTGELPDGIAKFAQNKIFNIPEVKAFVPFYKTVMNIFFEGAARVPGLHLLNSNTRKQLSGELGPQARRLALTKLVMGTGFITAWGSFSYGVRGEGDDWFITGQAPMDKKARDAMNRANIRPYSMVVKQPDGSYKSYEYKRFDPFGQMMGLAADMTYLASRPGVDTDSVEYQELIGATLNTLGAMMADNPLVDGANILGDLIDFSASDMDAWANRNLSAIAERGADYYGSIVNPYSGFNNTRLQITEPVKKDYTLNVIDGEVVSWEDFADTQNMSEATRTAYGAWKRKWNQIKDQSNFFNSDSPAALTLFAEEMKGPEQKWYSWTRVYATQWNDIDKAMLKYGLYLEMPDRSIAGVKLNDKEYYDFIMNMNNATEDFLDLGSNITFKQALDRLVKSESWIAKASSGDPAKLKEAHQEMKDVYKVYKDVAKQQFKASKADFVELSEEAGLKKYTEDELITLNLGQ